MRKVGSYGHARRRLLVVDHHKSQARRTPPPVPGSLSCQPTLRPAVLVPTMAKLAPGTIPMDKLGDPLTMMNADKAQKQPKTQTLNPPEDA